MVVMTKVTTPVIGWICSILGWVINGIYTLLDIVGIPNIGLAIILFTFVVYLARTPLQSNPQKYSTTTTILHPDIQKLQKKYKGKSDQDSMMKQNEELNAVYQKYGVSPTGSCVQLLIQMPVLLALYQVIYHIPGYITRVGNIFSGLADKIVAIDGYGEVISKFLTDNKITMYGISANTEFTKQTVIDFLYKLSPSQMEMFSGLSEMGAHGDTFEKVAQQASHINQFLNLNISDTPWAIIKSGMAQGGAAGWLMVIAAALIPILAWFTQWMNYKLMPQPETSKDSQPSTMEASMKSMNTIMPVMSAVFCFSFPVGIGIYWVIGAVIRSVQQVFLNKKMDTMDMEEYIKKNQEKARKKMEKRGISPEKINQQARMNVKNIQPTSQKKGMSVEERAAQVKKSTEYYNNTNYKPGSLASKANMVKQFDEKNKKK